MENRCLFIVNIDLVGYSTKTEPEQCKFAFEFHKKIKKILKAVNISEPIIIPTGDGIFLGYENIDPTEDYLKAMAFIFELKQWADKNELKFRSAIHYGPANIIERDVNGNRNLVGDLINNTARIISAGDDDAVIIHKDYYERFIRGNEKSIGKYTFKKIDSGTVLDKHHYTHICYSVAVDNGELQIGNTNKLKLNYMTQICSSDMPKPRNLAEKFPKRLKQASSVIFYGIYNPTTVNSIKEIDCSDNRKVDITVIYAADELRDDIHYFFNSNSGKLDSSNKQKSISDIKAYCATKTNISLHLKEYEVLPTFGASFIDFETSGKGFMHISNYLQCVVPDETPYFELEYLTDKMPYLYEYYFTYFNKVILKNLKEVK